MKKILGILIALMITTKAFASVTVMPTKIEFNANKTKANYLSTSIDIKGDDKEVMRFKVYPEYFTIDNKGEVVDCAGKTAPNDLSKKIKFVPSEFTVQPRKSQKIRLNVVNIKSLPDGESRCMLYIEDVNPKEYNFDTGRSNITAQLIVKTRIGVSVYVDKGKVVKNCDIENFNVTKDKNGYVINAKLVSTGNSKVRYKSFVQLYNGKKLAKEEQLTQGVVGDNNYNMIKDLLDLKGVPAGEYTLKYVVTYTDQNGKKINKKVEQAIQIKGEM